MQVHDWGLEANEGPSSNGGRATFFDRVTKDIEIVRVALLLTGCIQGRWGERGRGRKGEGEGRRGGENTLYTSCI
jgi:hypothetical protein